VSVCVADEIEQSRKGLRAKQRLLEGVSRRSRGIRAGSAAAEKRRGERVGEKLSAKNWAINGSLGLL